MYYFTLIALDIARERGAEADRYRRASLARAGQPARPSFIRTSTARAFAALSRGSAAAVRRLDAAVADDLQQGLALAE
ncbi:MAG: hypothetical protein ABIZ30_06010 [Candidatus Limnocylindrales bacterium]